MRGSTANRRTPRRRCDDRRNAGLLAADLALDITGRIDDQVALEDPDRSGGPAVGGPLVLVDGGCNEVDQLGRAVLHRRGLVGASTVAQDGLTSAAAALALLERGLEVDLGRAV